MSIWVTMLWEWFFRVHLLFHNLQKSLDLSRRTLLFPQNRRVRLFCNPLLIIGLYLGFLAQLLFLSVDETFLIQPIERSS